MEPPLRILIVAADPLVRSGLALRFENTAECEVVLTTDPSFLLSTELIEDFSQTDVDLILWDMGWESGNLQGLDFLELDQPVVSLVANDEQALEAWHAGAKAILSRESVVEELLAAFEATAKGLLVFDPSPATSLLPSSPRLLGDLALAPTARELQVLQLLAEGLTNRAIARELDISEHTVKFHVNAILNKLDAQSRTEAVVIATRLGLIIL